MGDFVRGDFLYARFFIGCAGLTYGIKFQIKPSNKLFDDFCTFVFQHSKSSNFFQLIGIR